MFKTRRELFEDAMKRWPESVMISEEQPRIKHCVFTEPCTNDIYSKIEENIGVNDNWRQVSTWSFHQAVDVLGRRLYKKGERALKFKDVSFKSFNSKMLGNMKEDAPIDYWKEEREIYLQLPLG